MVSNLVKRVRIEKPDERNLQVQVCRGGGEEKFLLPPGS